MLEAVEPSSLLLLDMERSAGGSDTVACMSILWTT